MSNNLSMAERCPFYPGELGVYFCGPDCKLYLSYCGGCSVKKYVFDLIDQAKTLIAEVMLEEILDLEKIPLWQLRDLESLWVILQGIMGRLGNAFALVNRAFPIYEWFRMEEERIKHTERTGNFRVSFIFPLEEWTNFKKYAAAEKRTAAAVLRDLIRDWIEERGLLFNNPPESDSQTP